MLFSEPKVVVVRLPTYKDSTYKEILDAKLDQNRRRSAPDLQGLSFRKNVVKDFQIFKKSKILDHDFSLCKSS